MGGFLVEVVTLFGEQVTFNCQGGVAHGESAVFQFELEELLVSVFDCRAEGAGEFGEALDAGLEGVEDVAESFFLCKRKCVRMVSPKFGMDWGMGYVEIGIDFEKSSPIKENLPKSMQRKFGGAMLWAMVR